MPTTPPTITPLPTPPDPNDRSTFNTRAYPWSVAQQTFGTEVAAVAANVYANATGAATDAGTATTQAAAAVAAAASAINAPGTSATSATSMGVSIGVKNIVLQQLGKAFTAGQPIVISRQADPAVQVAGVLLSHNPANGAFSVNATTAAGSGTFTDWNVALGIVVPSASGRGAGGASTTGNTTLTAASAGVQRITPTGPGQWVKLPDATTMTAGTGVYTLSNVGTWDMEVQDGSGAALGYLLPGTTASASVTSIATAAGVWELQDAYPYGVISTEISFPLSLGSGATGRMEAAIAIDDNRELLLFAGDARLYGVVWDSVSASFGSPVLIRAASVAARAIKSATDQVLVISCDASTAMEAVAFPVTGTTIGTLGTVATATLAGALSNMDDLIAVAGQGFVLGYRRATTTGAIRAVTVSGTTVAIGAESALGGDATRQTQLYDIGSSKLLAIDCTATTTINVALRTMSGTTLTSNTGTTVTTVSANYMLRSLASGRVAIIFQNGSSLTAGTIISVSGTVASGSTVALTAIAASAPLLAHVIGSQVIVGSMGTATTVFNVLTDNAGTAVAGTEITRDRGVSDGPVMIGYDATSVTAHAPQANTAATGRVFRIGLSGNNPTVLASRSISAANYTSGGYSQPGVSFYFKETASPRMLRGAYTSVAALSNTVGCVWVTRNGLPMLLQAQLAVYTGGGQGRVRSMTNNWEWGAQLNQTGLVLSVQKIKVA